MMLEPRKLIELVLILLASKECVLWCSFIRIIYCTDSKLYIWYAIIVQALNYKIIDFHYLIHKMNVPAIYSTSFT